MTRWAHGMSCLLAALSGCLALESEPDAWPCKSNGDCAQGERCRTQQLGGSICTPALSCQSDQECDAHWTCDQNVCTPPQCFEPNDPICGGFICSLNEHRCRTNCDVRTDCVPDHGCDAGRCVPAMCQVDTTGACGGFRCVEGVCQSWCGSSLDCEPGLACVRSQCEPMPGVGEGCSSEWDCPAVASCLEGACIVPWSLCEGMTCGEDQTFTCGTCGAGHLCTSEFVCANACVDVECGTFFGVDCGTCSGQSYCDPGGHCVDACSGMQCGTVHGVNCGACQGKTYCDANHACVDACGSAVCGLRNGVTCGQCPAGQGCDTGGHCKDQICVPLTVVCDGADRYACDSSGLLLTKVETCPAGTQCDALGCL